MKTYEEQKERLLDWQKKSPKYREYRRGYEEEYRELNRLQVRYNSWKSMQKTLNPEKEINYLLKRMLNEKE